MKLRGVAARSQQTRSTRDVILDVAERHFADRGFAGASVREIAADAGLRNQASLYHHFKNKIALYEAVLARGLDPIITRIAETGKLSIASEHVQAIGPDVAGGLLDTVVDYLAEHPNLPRLIQRAALDDSRYLRTAGSRLLRPLYAHGLEVLAAADESWEPAVLPNLALGLYNLIFGYFTSAKLIEIFVQQDPLTAEAMARQRRFLRTAVAQLLGTTAPRQLARVATTDRRT
jgi:AcrR family transcriptional regulator